MNGSGTSGDPWQVVTYSDLTKVGIGYDPIDDLTYALDDYYELQNDIDASASASGSGWLPIGTASTPFRGYFDGGGFIISDIFIDRSIVDVGLFGYVTTSAGLGGHVHDLGVTDVDITGSNSRVAAIAGYCRLGLIEDCYATGVINNSSERTGGIAGQLWQGGGEFGTALRCYSHVTINGGSNYTGGLVGRNNGVVEDCYSTGAVSNTGGTVGGLVGTTDATGTVTDSYWDTQTSGQSSSSGGTGHTTSEMQTLSTFSAWDIVDESSYVNEEWFIDSGNDYPRLGWQYEATSGIIINAESGTFTLTGQDAGLLADRNIIAESGNFSLSGQDAELLTNRLIQADSGTFILSGQEALLLANRIIDAESGSFNLSGQDIEFILERTINAESGIFSLIGNDANLIYSGIDKILNAESGSFILTGFDAELIKNSILDAESGIFNLIGFDAELIWSGDTGIIGKVSVTIELLTPSSDIELSSPSMKIKLESPKSTINLSSPLATMELE